MNKKIIFSLGMSLVGILGIVGINYKSSDCIKDYKIEIKYNYLEDEILATVVSDFMADATIDESYKTGRDPYLILENWIYETAYAFYGEENWNESLEYWFTDLNIKTIDDLEKFLLSEIWLAYLIQGKNEMSKAAWEAQYM